MRRRDDSHKGRGGKIIIRLLDNGMASSDSLPPDMKTDCGEDSSLLACPKRDINQEHGDVLTDDIDQQAQAVEKAKEDKKRRDKQLQADKAKLQIAKGNERLRALAGIKAE